MKDAVKTGAKPKMAARRSKEHKIPIMKVGRSKSKKREEQPRKKRGRPKGEGGRKRKADLPKDVPLKRPKMAMNGDAKHSNGTTPHPAKKTLKKKNNSILKNATFHPPISLPKRELLNGSSSLKFMPSRNKSSFKKDAEISSREASSKVGKVNNSISPQSTVSNELGRNLEKDTVQFSSKEPSKSKDVSKLLSKETVKSQSKESPKSLSKESSKVHPKETSKPQVKPQTKDNSKTHHKVQAKPLIKDYVMPKDVNKPAAKESPKSPPKEPQPVPVKRMASLDAMAKMHVICTTDRRPPEPRPVSSAVTKSITHERIQFDLKKETNDIKGNIVHKQEIKQQVFVSHSVEQSSIVEPSEKKKKKPAEKAAGKKLVKTKLKPPSDSKLICPKTEKGKTKSKVAAAAADKKVQLKKKSEVKVKETIRMQKTCTYESVTTVNSSSASSSVVPVVTTNFSKNNQSYCCKFHPQIIPLAHACSPPTFSFSHQTPIIFAPECGCCCPSSLMADSCLLRKSLVAFPHLPSHHAHHLSAPAFSSETVCSDCHPSTAPEYTIRSPPRTCCCDHLHHHGSVHRYLSKASSSPVPYAAEQSPLDLSTTAANSQRTLLCCRPEQQQLLLLRPQLHHTCCRCGKEAEPVLASGPVHPPVASTSTTTEDKSPSNKLQRRLSFAHGWSWKGKPRERLVALTNDSIPCPRICYPSVEHKEGDTISERDCVLLRSGPKETDLPYVAKVAAFWENPEDGEMMMSLLWYYRPEHTDQGRKTGQMEDEVFASRHKDVNSVACIEDKCYVLTYNEYCRYKASLSMDKDCVSSRVVPDLPDGYPRRNRLPCEPVSQDIVFFCRHVYDFRQKRILKNPT